MCCLAHGSGQRNCARGRDSGETLVAADCGVNRVKDCDMNNRHGAAGTAGPELFSKSAILTGCRRGVIEAGRVNRYPVPSVNHIGRGAWKTGCFFLRLTLKTTAICVFEITCRRASECGGGEGEKDNKGELHLVAMKIAGILVNGVRTERPNMASPPTSATRNLRRP